MAPTPTLLSEPTGPNALVAALRWIEALLLGSIATMVATVAVAAIGFLALQGRIDLRRAATVILGCFILFGAATIERSLDPGAPVVTLPAPAATVPRATRAPVTPYDPYAGASYRNPGR